MTVNFQDNDNTSSTTPSLSASDSEHFHNAMDKIYALLRKDRLDASLLGMESLDFLTDNSHSSNKNVSYLASRTVLIDDDGPWQFVRDEIIDLIAHVIEHLLSRVLCSTDNQWVSKSSNLAQR